MDKLYRKAAIKTLYCMILIANLQILTQFFEHLYILFDLNIFIVAFRPHLHEFSHG